MFNSGIESLRILSKNDQVNIGITRWDVRQISDRPEVRIKLELLPQCDIDTGEPTAYGRCDRPFKGHAIAVDRIEKFFRNVFVILLVSLGSRLKSFPFEFQSSCFEDADGCLRDFRADTVAGDKRDLVSHIVMGPASNAFGRAAKRCGVVSTLGLAEPGSPSLLRAPRPEIRGFFGLEQVLQL